MKKAEQKKTEGKDKIQDMKSCAESHYNTLSNHFGQAMTNKSLTQSSYVYFSHFLHDYLEKLNKPKISSLHN